MKRENAITASDPDWVETVLQFWFDELGPDIWFVKDAAVDQRISTKFLALYEELSARAGEVGAVTSQDALAEVLVLDQFPRNMFRDTPRAFATDEVALRLAKEALSKGLDQALSERERQFLYMPFQHSESVSDQEKSVALFEALGLERVLDYARRHKEVIDRFGRFPHRNSILERVSTADEQAYLNQPGSGF